MTETEFRKLLAANREEVASLIAQYKVNDWINNKLELAIGCNVINESKE